MTKKAKMLMAANTICWVKVAKEKRKRGLYLGTAGSLHLMLLDEDYRDNKKDDGMRKVRAEDFEKPSHKIKEV